MEPSHIAFCDDADMCAGTHAASWISLSDATAAQQIRMHSEKALCYDRSPSTAGEPTETDYTAVGCAITTISSNLTEMSKGVKLLAALIGDEMGSGHKLMGAARMLAGAVSDLLRSVEPAAAEVRQPLVVVQPVATKTQTGLNFHAFLPLAP